jgi:hypothetical protein
MSVMLTLVALVQSWIIVSVFRLRRLADDRGQTTAEYALVLVGVAAIALLVLAWATKTGAIGKLFDFVLGHITGQVK